MQAAAGAGLRSFSFPATGKMELRWTDRLDIETGFRIERKTGGSWQAVGTVAAGSSAQGAMSWSGPLDAAETPYRVLALFAQGQTLPLTAVGDRTEVPAGAPPGAAALSLSKAEPLQGAVDLLPSGLPTWQRVSYEIDADPSAAVEVVPELGYLGRWDTLPLSNGPHTVKALVEYSPNAFVELRRTVTTQNPDLVIQLYSQGGGQVTARVINRVSDVLPALALQVDGKDAKVLAAPNTTVCPPGKPCYPAYTFFVPIQNYSYGAHTITVATRGLPGDKIYSLSVEDFFNASPVLALDEPRWGTLVNDTLRISGTASDDSGQLNGEVFLDDVRIGTLVIGRFQIDQDVRGLKPGKHTVRVKVTDSRNLQMELQRLVIIQPASQDTFLPVARPATVVAENRTHWLFTDGNDQILLRPRDGLSADRLLSTEGLGTASRWLAAGDNWIGVFAKQMLMWKADGSRTTVATLSADQGYFNDAIATSTHVAWYDHSPTPAVRVLELASMSLRTLAIPSGFRVESMHMRLSADNKRLALALEKLESRNELQVYSYDLKTGASIALTGPIKGWPATDGVYVAWFKRSSDDPTAPSELWTVPLDGSSPAVRMTDRIVPTTNITWPHIGDGWIVWQEVGVGNVVARIGQPTKLLVLPWDSGVDLVPEGVFYGLEGRTYFWTAQSGTRVVMSAEVSVESRYGLLYLWAGAPADQSAGEQRYRLVLGAGQP